MSIWVRAALNCTYIRKKMFNEYYKNKFEKQLIENKLRGVKQ